MKIKVRYRSKVDSVGLKLNKVGVSSLALIIIGMIAGGLGIKYFSELSEKELVSALRPECNQHATTIENAVCMQDMNDSVAESMIIGQQYHLSDARDGKSYYIAKLADRHVWMTQNLDLDLNKDTKLTPSDSDVSADWKPAESTKISDCIDEDEDGNCEDLDLPLDETGTKDTTPESYDPGNLYWNGIIGDCDTCSEYQVYITDDSSNGHYHIGNFYNWNAATANNDSSGLVAGGEINQSICPAGWTLPSAYELPENNRKERDYMALLDYYIKEDVEDYEYPIAGFSTEDFNPLPYNEPLYLGYFREPGYFGAYWSNVYERSTNEDTRYVANNLEISIQEDGYIGMSGVTERKDVYNVRCVARSREAVSEPEPEPEKQVVSFESSLIEKTYGDATFINKASSTGDGEISYLSKNTSVATVDNSTGEVAIVGAGTATIIANATATANYNAASASYTLTVNKKESVKPSEVSEIKQGYVTDKLSTITLTTKGLVWADGNTLIKEGKNNYAVKYTENADSANYTTKTFEIVVDGEHREYKAIEGNKQAYVLGSEKYMVFKFNADYNLFEEGGEVYINEELLDSKNYTSESGSTIIKIANEYLKSLDEGDYVLAVHFNDGGIATASFSLKEQEVAVPDTGILTKTSEKTNSAGVYILPLLGTASLLIYGIVARKKQKISFNKE